MSATTNGARVAAARRAVVMTQAELARRIDRDVITVSRIERDVTDPAADTKVAIGRALGVDPNTLFRLGERADDAFPGAVVPTTGSMEDHACATDGDRQSGADPDQHPEVTDDLGHTTASGTTDGPDLAKAAS